MSSLSIVVPRLGTNTHFENTLASVLRYRLAHQQVVVVQSDLHADTYGLEGEIEFVEVPGRTKLATCLNQAIGTLTGDVVHILRPGVEVTHQWFVQAIRQLQDPKIGCVAATLNASNDRDEIVSRGLVASRSMMPNHVRSVRQKPTGPASWAGFYRRRLLESILPIDDSISDEMFALDLALSVRALGFGCEVVTDRPLTIDSTELLRLQSRSQLGRDAQRLVQRHTKGEAQTMTTVAAFGSDLLGSFWRPSRWPQLAGRFSAKSRRATDRAFSRRLALAKHELMEHETETWSGQSGTRTTRKAA